MRGTTLREVGVAEDTMVWFCSDNGPEGRQKTPTNGSAGPYRGRKRALYEGGVRVPAILEWPARIREARTTSVAASTLDYLPTICDALDYDLDADKPLDGVSILGLIEGTTTTRTAPIPFEHGDQQAWTGDTHKIISTDKGETFALYNLLKDPREEYDLAEEQPEILRRMRRTLAAWRDSR